MNIHKNTQDTLYQATTSKYHHQAEASTYSQVGKNNI